MRRGPRGPRPCCRPDGPQRAEDGMTARNDNRPPSRNQGGGDGWVSTRHRSPTVAYIRGRERRPDGVAAIADWMLLSVLRRRKPMPTDRARMVAEAFAEAHDGDFRAVTGEIISILAANG